ncbi:uncharacterized protein APUU_20170A [Aspergillus puulaauensis]|uniref:Uncharacterized protein n=1 Tax=Aspergillus puulaauensis TaxID=1220207 RepID=A0A7R7XEF8_9EURO|nr:uncharacterized protein APUU_20170A [Aspergillus puulaauensis]BCS19738.1 hypothetical protein APUU_20170A [Aspergillus puulaauensis]
MESRGVTLAMGSTDGNRSGPEEWRDQWTIVSLQSKFSGRNLWLHYSTMSPAPTRVNIREHETSKSRPPSHVVHDAKLYTA